MLPSNNIGRWEAVEEEEEEEEEKEEEVEESWRELLLISTRIICSS